MLPSVVKEWRISAIDEHFRVWESDGHITSTLLHWLVAIVESEQDRRGVRLGHLGFVIASRLEVRDVRVRSSHRQWESPDELLRF